MPTGKYDRSKSRAVQAYHARLRGAKKAPVDNEDRSQQNFLKKLATSIQTGKPIATAPVVKSAVEKRHATMEKKRRSERMKAAWQRRRNRAAAAQAKPFLGGDTINEPFTQLGAQAIASQVDRVKIYTGGHAGGEWVEVNPQESLLADGTRDNSYVYSFISGSTEQIDPPIPVLDLINHPRHYTSHPSGVECITVIEWMSLNVGNAIKYLWRADQKNHQLEDLQKARWYIDREISRLTKMGIKE